MKTATYETPAMTPTLAEYNDALKKRKGGWSPEWGDIINSYEDAHGKPTPEAQGAGNAKGAPGEAKAPYDLNDSYAVVKGTKAHYLWETTDAKGRDCVSHLSRADLDLAFDNKKMMDGKTLKRCSDVWREWKGRREYDGLVFNPGRAGDPRFYNLFRGWSVEPAAVGAVHDSVKMWLEHVHVNVCQKNEAEARWLLGYFAHLIQRPWEKPLTSLVFQGDKGVGKNALVERVKYLLGDHGLVAANPRYLIGNFNAHLERCLLFILDEAFWAGSKEAEGITKDLITGSTLLIERKGFDSYTVDNFTRVVIMGNAPWLVSASFDERRYAVFEVSDGRKQDGAFFQTMREGMEAGGYAVLLRYLMDYDLKGVDVNVAPKTKALQEQKAASLSPLEEWWADSLTDGHLKGSEFPGWPADINCDRFRAAFRRYCTERRLTIRSGSDDAIGRAVKKMAPGVIRRQRGAQEDATRPTFYDMPPLSEARAQWDARLDGQSEWRTDEEIEQQRIFDN